MSEKNNRNTFWIFIFLLAAYLPYLLLCFYANPAADDFEYAASAIKNGLWNSYLRDYLNWNGRYIANFFTFCSPLYFQSFIWYKIVPVVLFVLNYFSIAYLFKTFFNHSSVKIYVGALFVSLLYINNMPTLNEGFYWYTGAVTYILPQSFSLIYFSLMYNYAVNNIIISRTVHLITVSLLAIFIIGFNEVIMLVFLITHFALGVHLLLKRKNDFQLLSLVVVVFIACAVVLFSPGNEGRASNFSNKHNLLLSLKMSAFQCLRFGALWIFNAPFIICTFLCLLLREKLNGHPIFKNNFFIDPSLLLLALPLIIFICVFPAYWNMGILGQHRTLNTAYFFFVFLWLMNVHCWGNYLSGKQFIKKVLILKEKTGMLFTLFLIAVCFTNNGFYSLKDIVTNDAKVFNEEMSARYVALRDAKYFNAEVVDLKPLSAKPRSLFFADIKSDPKFWINGCWAHYFEVQQVQLQK